MANTTTLRGLNLLRGPSGTAGELHVYEAVVELSGTYATATKPNFNLLSLIQQQQKGASAITVRAVSVHRDLVDSGGTRYTAPNANIALSNVNAGCVGDKVTFRIDTASGINKNGAAPGETGDGTTIAGYMSFIALVEITA